MCDKTRLRWLSGSIIKQGDVSSEFKIKLLTEDDKVLNGTGRLQLIHTSKGMVELEVDIVNNILKFKLENALPVGEYIVEVEHDGYVFPSTNKEILKINENLGEFLTDEEMKLLGVKDIIEKYAEKKEEQEIPDLLMFYNIAKI